MTATIYEQDPIPTNEVLPPVNRGEKHLMIALLADASQSTTGKCNQELNEGLTTFYQCLQEDEKALGSCDIQIVEFNSEVKTTMPFRPAEAFEPVNIIPSGLTCGNQAIIETLEGLRNRKATYKSQGIGYYAPVVVCFTDGAFTDDEYYEQARNELQTAIANRKITFLPFAIGEYADVEALKTYYPDNHAQKIVFKVTKENLKECFVWISASVNSILNSKPDQKSISAPQLPIDIELTC